MELKVSSPGNKLSDEDVDRIQRDLEKIDRRLHNFDPVYAEVRINGGDGPAEFHVTLELEYGRNHLIAKADSGDMGHAVRAAREEILRQINDRSRGSHSQYAKGR
jgi:ribosome-associated translation inhibitor RaiA